MIFSELRCVECNVEMVEGPAIDVSDEIGDYMQELELWVCPKCNKAIQVTWDEEK